MVAAVEEWACLLLSCLLWAESAHLAWDGGWGDSSRLSPRVWGPVCAPGMGRQSWACDHSFPGWRSKGQRGLDWTPRHWCEDGPRRCGGALCELPERKDALSTLQTHFLLSSVLVHPHPELYRCPDHRPWGPRLHLSTASAGNPLLLSLPLARNVAGRR